MALELEPVSWLDDVDPKPKKGKKINRGQDQQGQDQQGQAWQGWQEWQGSQGCGPNEGHVMKSMKLKKPSNGHFWKNTACVTDSGKELRSFSGISLLNF